jgi:hypothetical protein
MSDSNKACYIISAFLILCFLAFLAAIKLNDSGEITEQEYEEVVDLLNDTRLDIADRTVLRDCYVHRFMKSDDLITREEYRRIRKRRLEMIQWNLWLRNGVEIQ